MRWLACLPIAAVVLAACGGSTEVSGGDFGAGVAAEDVAFEFPGPAVELVTLGSLPVARSAPQLIEVTEEGSKTVLADGASLVVPAGAFESATRVSAQVFDLDFGELSGDLAAEAYLLSAPDDVDLSSPIFLEIAGVPEDVSVAERVDDTWQPAVVAPGDAVRIPIDGFSTRAFIVPTYEDVLAIQNRLEYEYRGVPAEHLDACIQALTLIFARPDGGYAALGQSFYAILALCVDAHADGFEEGDPTVEFDCLQYALDPEDGLASSFAEAIELCEEEPSGATSDRAAPGAAGLAEEVDNPPPSEAATEGLAEPGSWTGTIEFDPVAGKLVDSYVGMERLVDGSYTLSAYVEFTRESGNCFWVELQTAEGTGRPSPDGTRIEFEVEFTSDIEASGDGCAGGSETFTTTAQVDLGRDTISGSIFPYTTFTIAR